LQRSSATTHAVLAPPTGSSRGEWNPRGGGGRRRAL